MKISRTVLGALLAAGTLSAVTLSTPPAQADDTKMEGSRSGKMRHDNRTSDQEKYGTGDNRMSDRDSQSTGNRSTEKDTRSASDKISDQALETKVKTALIGDTKVKARKIEVEARSGVVNLSGTVASQTEAESAISTARRVSGVSVVNSKLSVEPNP